MQFYSNQMILLENLVLHRNDMYLSYLLSCSCSTLHHLLAYYSFSGLLPFYFISLVNSEVGEEGEGGEEKENRWKEN